MDLPNMDLPVRPPSSQNRNLQSSSPTNTHITKMCGELIFGSPSPSPLSSPLPSPASSAGAGPASPPASFRRSRTPNEQIFEEELDSVKRASSEDADPTAPEGVYAFDAFDKGSDFLAQLGKKRSSSAAGLDGRDEEPKKALVKPAIRPSQSVARRMKTPPPRPLKIRPVRERRAPERYGDKSAEEEEEKKKKKKSASATPAAAPKKKEEVGKSPSAKTSTTIPPTDNPLTTNMRSKLLKYDLFHMLLQDSAWTPLPIQDKLDILNLLPRNPAVVRLISRLEAGETDIPRPREFTVNFTPFRSDVARYMDDLRNGHYNKGWQTLADQATIDRAEGKFDNWKAEEQERWWGQHMKAPVRKGKGRTRVARK